MEDVEYHLYLHRRYVRWCRRCERDIHAALWGDTPEAREDAAMFPWTYNDIFNLKKLFGLEPYEEVEDWNCKYTYFTTYNI